MINYLLKVPGVIEGRCDEFRVLVYQKVLKDIRAITNQTVEEAVNVYRLFLEHVRDFGTGEATLIVHEDAPTEDSVMLIYKPNALGFWAFCIAKSREEPGKLLIHTSRKHPDDRVEILYSNKIQG